MTGMEGCIWRFCRYDAYGTMTYGKPEYNNVYGYNAESYNPATADFMTEDSYLEDIRDPLTLNRYNYVKSSPLNYVDPSGHENLSGDETLQMFGTPGKRETFGQGITRAIAECKEEMTTCEKLPIAGSFVIGFQVEGSKYFDITNYYPVQ